MIWAINEYNPALIVTSALIAIISCIFWTIRWLNYAWQPAPPSNKESAAAAARAKWSAYDKTISTPKEKPKIGTAAVEIAVDPSKIFHTIPSPSEKDCLHGYIVWRIEVQLLVHRYVAMNYQHQIESIPNEIIGLIFKFYSAERMVPNYSEILDILLNKECFIIVYDIESDEWIPAVYINQFERTQRIMVEFLYGKKIGGSRWHILKDFPIDYVRRDAGLFKIKETDLKSLPQDCYDTWIERNH